MKAQKKLQFCLSAVIVLLGLVVGVGCKEKQKATDPIPANTNCGQQTNATQITQTSAARPVGGSRPPPQLMNGIQPPAAPRPGGPPR